MKFFWFNFLIAIMCVTFSATKASNSGEHEQRAELDISRAHIVQKILDNNFDLAKRLFTEAREKWQETKVGSPVLELSSSNLTQERSETFSEFRFYFDKKSEIQISPLFFDPEEDNAYGIPFLFFIVLMDPDNTQGLVEFFLHSDKNNDFSFPLSHCEFQELLPVFSKSPLVPQVKTFKFFDVPFAIMKNSNPLGTLKALKPNAAAFSILLEHAKNQGLTMLELQYNGTSTTLSWNPGLQDWLPLIE